MREGIPAQAEPQTLDGWLDYISALHHRPMDLGLERINKVRDALVAPAGAERPVVITVAGTNGKGSTCAMLEAILLASGYRVGLYTSPHLLRYTERVRVQGQEISPATLVSAFQQVEAARRQAGDISLTYFEFGTLAAWRVFSEIELYVVILEVGLGGRLDAVNAFEPDCAVVTSVDIDHVEFLGNTRESIGFEKAGIFRAGKPAIVADPVPPQSLKDFAASINADLQLIGRDFGYQGDRQQWGYWGRGAKRAGMAFPALRGANQLLNASAALAALDSLRERLPVDMGAVRGGLATVSLPARFQVMPGKPAVILDVAHNPHAAAVLSENLSNMGFFPETYAVLGMLADKDIEGVCRRLKDRVTVWHVAPLPGPRGATAEAIQEAIVRSGASGAVRKHESPRAAYLAARQSADENDRIVVFGSFLTVADVMPAL